MSSLLTGLQRWLDHQPLPDATPPSSPPAQEDAPCPVVASAAVDWRTASEPDAKAWDVWTEPEMAAFSTRVAQFERQGAPDPEDAAERLLWRDRDDEGRVMCLECAHYRGGRCWNRREAGLNQATLGELATTLQRCPGFKAASAELEKSHGR